MAEVAEIWKTHPKFDAYEVSSLGCVRRVKKARGVKVGRILSQRRGAGSTVKYVQVTLSQDNVRHHCYVHRLVLETFVGPCPEGMEARHYPDMDPSNNRLENLSCSTHRKNLADRE